MTGVYPGTGIPTEQPSKAPLRELIVPVKWEVQRGKVPALSLQPWSWLPLGAKQAFVSHYKQEVSEVFRALALH